jgi:CheY-like chemotaxis protein
MTAMSPDQRHKKVDWKRHTNSDKSVPLHELRLATWSPGVFGAQVAWKYQAEGSFRPSRLAQRRLMAQRGESVLATTPSLLITDDDRDFRETLRGVFEPRGLNTILAGDGEEALEIVRGREVHLILLDMHMPRLSGLDTIRLVKELRGPLPCILMSAGLDERLAEEARLADAFSVLHKPVRFEVITRVVRDALRRFYDWPWPVSSGGR